jgi:hypothetical protein
LLLTTGFGASGNISGMARGVDMVFVRDATQPGLCAAQIAKSVTIFQEDF